MKKKSRKRILFVLLLLITAIGLYLVKYVYERYVDRSPDNIPTGILELAEYNYSDEVRELSEEYNLSYSYLMSLIVLESSGRKPPGKRFEIHVFHKLKALRDGHRKAFEDLRREDVANATDEALKNLATSWGPFQLMGYKCIGLDVNIRDFRNEDGVELGVRWIDKEYGDLLQQKRFKDAFHYHNTGRTLSLSGIPATHDPQYIYKGIRYMKHFEK